MLTGQAKLKDHRREAGWYQKVSLEACRLKIESTTGEVGGTRRALAAISEGGGAPANQFVN